MAMGGASVSFCMNSDKVEEVVLEEFMEA